MMHDWSWKDAEREFLRGLDLNPGYPTAHHWYAEFLMVMGRIEEAISHSKRAVELDPLGLIVHVLLGMAYHFARRNEEAVDELTKVLEMEPAYQPAFIWLGQAYLQLEQYVEAVETFKTEVELSPQRSTTRAYLAAAHAFAGEEDEARQLLGDLEARSADGYVSAFDFAIVYFALEEDDVGFEWMNKAVEERAPWLTWLAVDPMFDRVRKDPRFTALLEQLQLA
jgi:tetratricopeptide (TPR) repeat protein